MRIRPITCLSLVSMLAACGFGGCASREQTTAGEVPPGYDSWEDYSRAQDAQQVEIERAHRRNMPTQGVPK